MKIHRSKQLSKEADGALFNNASQAWNHIFLLFSVLLRTKAKDQKVL